LVVERVEFMDDRVARRDLAVLRAVVVEARRVVMRVSRAVSWVGEKASEESFEMLVHIS